MDSVFRVLHRLAAEYGPRLAAVLIITLAAFALVLLYLVLEYGHRAGKMFIPLVTMVIKTLAGEKDNDHPAIRVEYAMHRILILLFFVCLGFLALHSLILWHVQINEALLETFLVSLLIVILLLAGISYRFASRLR
jgi:hypothetical protein